MDQHQHQIFTSKETLYPDTEIGQTGLNNDDKRLLSLHRGAVHVKVFHQYAPMLPVLSLETYNYHRGIIETHHALTPINAVERMFIANKGPTKTSADSPSFVPLSAVEV